MHIEWIYFAFNLKFKTRGSQCIYIIFFKHQSRLIPVWMRILHLPEIAFTLCSLLFCFLYFDFCCTSILYRFSGSYLWYIGFEWITYNCETIFFFVYLVFGNIITRLRNQNKDSKLQMSFLISEVFHINFYKALSFFLLLFKELAVSFVW